MTKLAKPENLKVTVQGSVMEGFIYEEPEVTIPPLDITLTLPDGKKTGCRLKLENLIKKVFKMYPKRVTEIIKRS